MSTGVFQQVTVQGADNTLIIEVTEVEQHPGRLDFGLSWISDRGLTGTLGYGQFNLIPNTFTAAQFDISRDAKSYDLSAFRPDTFGKDWDFGIQIMGERTAFEDLDFSVRSLRVETSLSWTPEGPIESEVAAGYRNHRMFDVNALSSGLLFGEANSDAGHVSAPYLRLGASYRTAEAEETGTVVNLQQVLWNLGTDQRISETRVGMAARVNIGKQNAILLGVNGGRVQGLSGSNPTALDRFFLGGDSFRGFAPRGLGPAEGSSRVGANRYLVASVELQRELGNFLDRDFQGGVFFQAGSAWGLDDTLGGRIDDSRILRTSVGLTVSFNISETPVSLYLAAPLKYEETDKRQIIGLNINTTF